MELTKSAQNTVLRLQIELMKSAQSTALRFVDRTDEVSSKHGFEVVDKEKLMWFEEVFEECKKILVS
ncbi:hypothetical protein [Streptococcus pneumoniae]|uniref:hypothetical protein n=1 Tax=Streptococcus pneumoniae TaxID=1313 RepID=UPI0009916902|nr:hypothetical protein [Streptococcus pneumoniae]